MQTSAISENLSMYEFLVSHRETDIFMMLIAIVVHINTHTNVYVDIYSPIPFWRVIRVSLFFAVMYCASVCVGFQYQIRCRTHKIHEMTLVSTMAGE